VKIEIDVARVTPDVKQAIEDGCVAVPRAELDALAQPEPTLAAVALAPPHLLSKSRMIGRTSPIAPFAPPSKRPSIDVTSAAAAVTEATDFSDRESQRVLTAACPAVAREWGREAAREYFAELIGQPGGPK
jgi:hypothetical protein